MANPSNLIQEAGPGLGKLAVLATKMLRDFRHVYNKKESEDVTDAHRALRGYFKERPNDFLKQLATMEAQHTARLLKRQKAGPLGGIVVDSGKKVEDDDGTERVKGLLDRSLEEFS